MLEAMKANEGELWEDNWDDDDVEDEFTKTLRCVLRYSSSSSLDLGVIRPASHSRAERRYRSGTGWPKSP